MKTWSFKVNKDEQNNPVIPVEMFGMDQILTPHEVSAVVLQKMKLIAEDYLNETVTDVVITVPAYFTDA